MQPLEIVFFDGSSLGTRILLALFFFKEQNKFLILLLIRTARRQEPKCYKLKPNTSNQAWMCLCSWRILRGFFSGFKGLILDCLWLLVWVALLPSLLWVLGLAHAWAPPGEGQVGWHEMGRVQPCINLLFHLLTSSSLQAEEWAAAAPRCGGCILSASSGGLSNCDPFPDPCSCCSPSRHNQVWANSCSLFEFNILPTGITKSLAIPLRSVWSFPFPWCSRFLLQDTDHCSYFVEGALITVLVSHIHHFQFRAHPVQSFSLCFGYVES